MKKLEMSTQIDTFVEAASLKIEGSSAAVRRQGPVFTIYYNELVMCCIFPEVLGCSPLHIRQE